MSLHSPFFRLGLALIALWCAGAGPGAYAAFPEKPVRLIVPFAPGGGTDLISRALGAGMAKALGQPVVIENKPGAGTVIGMDAVAKGAPDGYVIVMATFAHAVNPSLLAKLPYSNDQAFAPISLIARGPNVLAVRADSAYKTIADIVAAARAKPGVLTYASQGNGTSAHLAGEMLDNLARIEMTHVPYRGAGPAMTDVMGGQVDMIFGTAAAVSPLIAAGKLRAIAVTSEAPSPAFKGVPTIGATVQGFEASSWFVIMAPAKTPEAIVRMLNAAAKAAAGTPEFLQKAEQEGLTVTAGSPTELDAYVRGEEARWHKIVTENKIRLD